MNKTPASSNFFRQNALPRKILLSFILLFGASVHSQVMEYFYDASITQLKGYGYSYNIGVQLNLASEKTDGSQQFEMRLARVSPDSRGFLYNGKYYQSSVLGSECSSPQYFDRIFVTVKYQYVLPTGMASSASYDFGPFENIGAAKTGNLGRNVSNVRIDKVRVVRDDTGCTAKIRDLLQGNQTGSQAGGQPKINGGSTEVVINNAPSSARAGEPEIKLPSTQDRLRDLGIDPNASEKLASYASAMREEARAEREAADRREERRQMQVLAELEQKLARRQLQQNRVALINRFPHGSLPTSSQVPQKTSEVYFFLYSYDENQLETNSPMMLLSNVFAVSRYGDGSWPMAHNLTEKIEKEFPELEFFILSGFHTDENTALQQRQELVDGASQLGFAVESVNFEPAKPSASAQTDYWGNPVKQTSNETPPAKTSTTDYWGNPIKN